MFKAVLITNINGVSGVNRYYYKNELDIQFKYLTNVLKDINDIFYSKHGILYPPINLLEQGTLTRSWKNDLFKITIEWLV